MLFILLIHTDPMTGLDQLEHLEKRLEGFETMESMDLRPGSLIMRRASTFCLAATAGKSPASIYVIANCPKNRTEKWTQRTKFLKKSRAEGRVRSQRKRPSCLISRTCVVGQ